MATNLSKLYSITYPGISAGMRPIIIEHQETLFCLSDHGLFSSQDGVFWENVSPNHGNSASIASFKGELWCCFMDSYQNIKFLTSSDKGKTWNSPPLNGAGFTTNCSNVTMITHTTSGGEEKLVVVYSSYQGPIKWVQNPLGNQGGGDGSMTPQHESIGLAVNFTTDGKTWSNKGNVNAGGYPLSGDKTQVQPFMNISADDLMSTNSFKGTLYWTTQFLEYLTSLNDKTNCFNTPKYQSYFYNDFNLNFCSLVNDNNSQYCFFLNSDYHNYLCFIQSTDGNTYSQTINYLPGIYTSNGVSGLVFNNAFFIANSSSDKNMDAGLFNIITNNASLDFPQSDFQPETYEIDSSKNLSITTLCPRIYVQSAECYAALGKGTDNNYYYVFFPEDPKAEIKYLKIPEEPSHIVKNPNNDTWVSFTAGTNLYIVDPATPVENHKYFQLSKNLLLTPVCGVTESQIIVQDTEGKLIVGNVESNGSNFDFSNNSYQLSPSGNFSPFTKDHYLYTYNQKEDIIEVYDMSTSNYGTPICSSGKLNIADFSKQAQSSISINDSYILVTLKDGTTTKNLLIEPYKQGASKLNANEVDILEVTPQPYKVPSGNS